MTFNFFNIKTIASLFILFLSSIEFIVFNEEVFIFLCFFLFINFVSSRFSENITESLSEESKLVKNSFLTSSYTIQNSILSLIKIKTATVSLINKTIFVLKSHQIYTYQRLIFFEILPFVALKSSIQQNLLLLKDIYDEKFYSLQDTISETYKAARFHFFLKKIY